MISSEDNMTRSLIYLATSPSMAPIQGACGISCMLLMGYLFKLSYGFSSPQNFAGIPNGRVLCGPLRNGNPLSCGTFVSVQHGTVIRGHRGVERMNMMSSPIELWNSYLGALDAYPLLTKSITAGVIFPAADLAAQILNSPVAKDRSSQPTLEASEKTSGVDWDVLRSLRWLIFGFAVQAPWNHYFYVLLDGALPPTPDPLSTTTFFKVFIDQFVQAPVFTVIIFGVLGLLEGKTASNIREQLNADYGSTMLANWGIFVPAAVINLAFCPPQLRVLFLNVVFFVWTIYLSTVVSGGDRETVTER